MKVLALIMVSILCAVGIAGWREALSYRDAWHKTEQAWIEQRDNDAKQIAVALSREELLSLCDKLVKQDDGFLADRLREKGGLPEDPRWRQVQK
jgi:hypothetical protein